MSAWTSLEDRLTRTAPQLVLELTPGASAGELDGLEKAVGYALPASVRAWWLACGGQSELDGAGIAGGFVMLSPAHALAEWKMWADLRERESEDGMDELRSTATSKPKRAIREEYTHPGWIPLWREPGAANYLGVDLDPGPAGAVGQVICFGRDVDDKRVLFGDYEDALAWLAAELEAKQLTLREGDGLVHARGYLLAALPSAPKVAEMKKKAAKSPRSEERAAEALPGPLPKQLPGEAQAALDRYVDALREVLAVHPGPQTEAYENRALDPPEDPKGATLGGDPLRMEPFKPPVAKKKLPPEEVVRTIAKLSLDAGTTLARFEIRFARGERGWTHEVSLETAENRKLLSRARKALDAEIGGALATALEGREGWQKAWLGYERSPAPKLTLTVRGETRDVEDPPAGLRALFERVEALHARFGMRLRTATWSIEADAGSKVSAQTYYG
jgi:cell wall assembly regulator SMI1/NAD(P)-dependent dehydrogenase (short-subunit alcohol dehydrogenase family)